MISYSWAKDREPEISGPVTATVAQRSASHLQEAPTRTLFRSVNPINVSDALFPSRHLWVAIACGPLLSANLLAEPVPVRHLQGSGHGFVALKTLEGKLIAVGDMTQPAQPVEIAPVFVFLASNEASYITGEVYGVTGGQTPF